jgi:hypothetical protein
MPILVSLTVNGFVNAPTGFKLDLYPETLCLLSPCGTLRASVLANADFVTFPADNNAVVIRATPIYLYS